MCVLASCVHARLRVFMRCMCVCVRACMRACMHTYVRVLCVRVLYVRCLYVCVCYLPRSSFREILFVFNFHPVEAGGSVWRTVDPECTREPCVDGAALWRLVYTLRHSFNRINEILTLSQDRHLTPEFTDDVWHMIVFTYN